MGGCVRDYLLGLTPHDTDICTNALPEQTKKCFESYHTFDTGIKHGTISVVCCGEVYEITTYRIDGDYSDNRHPDSVSFTRNINEDLQRRDFTVNAMAYNTEYGLVDPYGGKNDLKDKIIRCVGNPDTRFNEDALRILRALRFASVYGFSIEENTSKSIFKNADLLKNIATERVISEFLKLICGKDAVKILDAYRETIAVIIPEITAMFNFNQNNIHHSYDLWQHTLTALGTIEPNPILRMTMLLHDIGKPSVKTTDNSSQSHFQGHQLESKKIADRILHRLRLPSDFINKTLLLIEYHDVRFNGSKKLMKKVMNVLGTDLTKQLLEVEYADISAQSEYQREEKLGYLSTAKTHLNEIIKDNECFKLSQLDINGKDILNLGVKEGRDVGNILDYLLMLVVDANVPNKKSILISKAEEYIYGNQINK
ncbi:CCA-adding enzyme [uncultured Ruminococcus sp.]|nr:CCA-adding enzyme [uncultured Ruminococcus sp.]